MGDAVRFLGEVGDVYGQMARWDLFAYATTANEGLGNAVAEAMMFGLPCVVTDVGPMREFAGDGSAVRSARPVLDDVEEMLREVASLEDCARFPDLERLQGEIERRQLLMKVRLMQRELLG